jgi:hypothetical protein
MFQDDNVPGIYATPFFVRIDLEAVLVERPYPIVLILKIDDTVASLEGPDEGKTGLGTFLGPCSVFAEGNDVVFLTAGDTGIKRIEDAVVIRIEPCLLIFPGGIRQKIDIVLIAVLNRTSG